MKKLVFFAIMLSVLILFAFTLTFSSAVTIRNSNVTNGVIINRIGGSSGGGGSAGANVTSVSSGDGCIFVSPTTGDVIITFNTSCGSGGSFNATYDKFAYNQTQAVFLLQLLNETISNYGVRIGFNSTSNSTYEPFAYNQTNAVFLMALLNETIANYGVRVGFNASSTFFLTDQTNNNLNKSANVTFNNITVAEGITVGKNVTANWFKGLFNWVIGAQPSQRYLTFNGSTLDFNESALNGTIDNRASGISSTVANNTYVRKTGDNMSGVLEFDQAGFGKWLIFKFAGIQLGTITSELGLFEFHALSGVDFYMSNTGRDNVMIAPNTGNIQMVSASGFKVATIIGGSPTFETNTSGTLIISNTKINGTINATTHFGLNFTANDLTASRALDTIYTNNNPYPLLIQVTGDMTVDDASSQAFMNCESPTGTVQSRDGVVSSYFITGGAASNQEYRDVTCTVKKNSSYMVSTNSGGSGSITLLLWREYPIK